MVTIEDILPLFDDFNVSIRKNIRNKNVSFLEISDKENPSIGITLHLFKGALIGVEFINNVFTELSDGDLLSVVKTILSGDYRVKKLMLSRKYSIVIGSGHSAITPDSIFRIENQQEAYRNVPYKFSRR
jgi:hypothetical protein